MSREIAEAKNNGGLVSAIDNQGLGEMLKPLIREIHLFDSYISGTSTVPDASVFDKTAVDDSLTLLREESKFDSNTIVLLTEDKIKLGYVPEKDSPIFARLMDAGKMLKARITKIDRKGSFVQIGIGIYLIDF